MVSHQLVYVTGMLEVILGPFRPLGRLKTGGGAFRGLGRRQGRRPSLPGTRKTSQAAAAAPRPRKSSKQVAEVCIDLRATASNQNHASERSLYPYGDLPDWWF